MKKILITFMVLVMLCVNTFALSIEYDQSSILREYSEIEKGNSLYEDLVGSVSTTQNLSIIIGNTTHYYDLHYEFNDVTEEMYFIIQNYFENVTLQIMWHGDLSRDATFYSQDFSFNAQGRYYFKFNPATGGEPAQVYFNYVENSAIGSVEYQESKPQGFNAVMSGFIGAFESVIDYNLAFWQIGYSAIIFLGVLLFILIIFGISFTLFLYSKRIENRNKSKSHEES